MRDVPESGSWTFDTEPVLASVVCGAYLIVIEALDAGTARVLKIEIHSGTAAPLFDFACDRELLYGVYYAGQLVLTRHGAFVVADLQSTARTTVSNPGLEPLAAPLEYDGALFCLWRAGDRYCVTRWANGENVCGPSFDDRQFRYVRGWAIGADGPIVRLEITAIGRGEKITSALYFIDPRTLEPTMHAVDSGEHILATKQHLFIDEARRAQTEPSLRSPGIRLVRDHAGFVLTCLDARTRTRLKQWVVGSTVTSVIGIPRFAGVLLTMADPESNRIISAQSYGVLTPNSTGVRVLAETSGTAIGTPVHTSGGVLSLVHEGGNRGLYDTWLRSGGSKPTKGQARVVWQDSNGRPQGDINPNHHYYRLEELDLAARTLRVMQFWASSPARSVMIANDRVIVVLGREVRSYTFADFRGGAQETPLDATGVTALAAPTSDGGPERENREALFGSPLTGPRDELWGIHSKMPALDAFVALQPARRHALAAGDEDARLELLITELRDVERELLRHHDHIARVATTIPAEFLGELGTPACLQFIAWERAALAGRRGASDDAVHASARMIFQDYIRQRSLLVQDRSEVLAEVQRNRRGPFARALAWCSVAELGTPEADSERAAERGEKMRAIAIWSIVPGLVLVLAGVLGKLRIAPLLLGLIVCACAALLWVGDWLSDVAPAFVRGFRGRAHATKITDDPRVFTRLSEQWPNGAPACVIEPDRYLQFITTLRTTTLLSPTARSSRQRAVLLAGELLRHGLTVFISHSSRQAATATALAEALRARGVEVMIDRWHLEPGAPDEDVESWIAESMIRADAVVYLVSKPAAASGWVIREQAWEYRLLAVKRSRALPFLVYLEQEVAHTQFPRTRCFGQAEMAALGVPGLADALTRQIVADRIDVLREVSARRAS